MLILEYKSGVRDDLSLSVHAGERRTFKVIVFVCKRIKRRVPLELNMQPVKVPIWRELLFISWVLRIIVGPMEKTCIDTLLLLLRLVWLVFRVNEYVIWAELLRLEALNLGIRTVKKRLGEKELQEVCSRR